MGQIISGALYAPIQLDGGKVSDELRKLRLSQGRRDMYCPRCGQQATWTNVVHPDLQARAERERATVAPISSRSAGTGPTFYWTEAFALNLQCTRAGHLATFHCVVQLPKIIKAQTEGEKPDPAYVIKVGQWPSLTDFQLGDLSAFQAGMTREQRKEFVRGINTGAHGFSVAACVYFRRVFESVLRDARDEYLRAHRQAEWPEYDAAHAEERIRLLRGFLPDFVVEHPELYRMLSLGVHELTEEQTAQELPMLRQAVELIMMDRVTEARRGKQREDVAKLLAQRINHHRNPGGPESDADPQRTA